VELLCQEFWGLWLGLAGWEGLIRMQEHTFCAITWKTRAIAEATGKRPVVFVGISHAGKLAVHFATTYPHLVEKLVLVGTHPTTAAAADNSVSPPK
jgi:hypothetical protein